METIDWGRAPLRITAADVPSCWKNMGILEPRGFGLGRAVLGLLRGLAKAVLSRGMAEKALSMTESLYQPRPAYVYAIPAGCSFRVVSSRIIEEGAFWRGASHCVAWRIGRGDLGRRL